MTDLKTAIEVGRKLAADAYATPYSTSRQKVFHGVDFVWKGGVFGCVYETQRPGANADYLVHCANSWPLLAAEIERLERELDAFKRFVG